MPIESHLTFDPQGLIPAVVTDVTTGRLLTLCYLDREALQRTLATGQVYVYRRSASRVMLKGETSGHTQEVVELRPDCCGKSLEIRVRQRVAVCHQGYVSCYYRRYDPKADALRVTDERAFDPATVYGAC